MRNSPDPAVHQQRERQFLAHAEKLLSDDRLQIDTVAGRRPVARLMKDVTRGDRAVDMKRALGEAGRPDRELQSRMPTDGSIEVALSQQAWWVFRRAMGRLRVVSLSPVRELARGEAAPPMDADDVRRALGEVPPPLRRVPSTVVLMSTSGFEPAARDAARRSEGYAVILAEPDDAGGWRVTAPEGMAATAELFNPEAEAQKRQRVRDAVKAATPELVLGSVSAEKMAAKTGLPLALVESELKSFAKQTAGLAAKRLDGKLVLYREASAPAGAAGGAKMPLIDRMKALFAGKGETEKKIAFLSERRAALGQQRDGGYDEIGVLEAKEAELRQQFKDAGGDLTKRRVTGQLLQLRKDIERRQQLLSVLNQQINVVSTHLHNLELVRQGDHAKLPDSEEMATDAAAAEEMLAELEASGELAGSIGVSGTGMSEEEQALYDELNAEAAGEKATVQDATTTATGSASSAGATRPASTAVQGSGAKLPPVSNRPEPEAG